MFVLIKCDTCRVGCSSTEVYEFEDGTDRAVDVYKSTGDGTEPPHYAIYISYEDDNSDWEYTDGLSVEELEKKIEELSQ